MTKVQIELSDATARAAREAGLLTSEALERLLTDAIRRRQAEDAFLAVAERVAEPVSSRCRWKRSIAR